MRKREARLGWVLRSEGKDVRADGCKGRYSVVKRSAAVTSPAGWFQEEVGTHAPVIYTRGSFFTTTSTSARAPSLCKRAVSFGKDLTHESSALALRVANKHALSDGPGRPKESTNDIAREPPGNVSRRALSGRLLRREETRTEGYGPHPFEDLA